MSYFTKECLRSCTGDVVRYVEDAVNSVPILGDVTKSIGNIFNAAVNELGRIPAVGG